MQNRPANGFYKNARKYNVHDKSRTNAGSIVRPQLLPSRPSSFGWEYEARSGLKMSLTRAKRYISRMLFPSYRQPRSPKIMSSFPSVTIPSLDMAGNTRFIALCAVWYMTSAMSSNTGKAIMQHFRFPITLTIVQFAFVAAYCILAMSPLVQFTRFRPPTKAILRNTLPMGMFQVGGHVFSSIAISRIPVSTLHTIKALSPLFTVAAYALLFGVSYSSKTYISLLPLTLGVMLACSFDMSASNAIGLLCAFGSALVFVSSNIFFKKIMPSGSSQTAGLKLDKVNLLFYSSSMAFLLMIPLWLYEDLPTLLAMRNEPAHVTHPAHGHETAHSVGYYFFMNGTVHFAQNLIAFIILSSTSPVTYSIASLIKRVAVICIAIVWFNQSVHPIQGLGITLTFIGLYMYNNAKSDVEKGEKKMRRVEAAKDLMLPSTNSESLDTMENVQFVQPMRSSGAETSSMVMGGQMLYGRHRGGPPVGPPPPSARMHTFQQPTHMYAAPRHQPPTTHHAHSRVTPNLSVKVTPEQLNPLQSPMFDQRIQSPMESYPSPPPSLDSPPRRNLSLGYAEHDHFSATPRHVSVRA